METKHVAMNEKQQAALRKAVTAICKEHNTGVRAHLETRLSYRERDPENPKAAWWAAYSRFLLDDGHTVYVQLRTMEASYSKDVDKFAQSKVEKAIARAEKKAAKKAARAAKAQAKAAKKAEAVTVKTPVVKAPKAKGVPRVAFDPTLDTLDASGKTTPGTKSKAKRTKKADDADRKAAYEAANPKL
jgi:hypothetical protein